MAEPAAPSFKLELSGLSQEQDLALMQYLAGKYSPAMLMNMFDSVEPSSARNGPASRFSCSSTSTSEIGSWRSSQSSFLTTNSISSFDSAASASASCGRRLGAQRLPTVAVTASSTPSAMPATPESISDARGSQLKAYPCPFCAQHGIHDGAAKPSDLVRHLKKHRTDAQWSCVITGCGYTSDFSKAYVNHMKITHPGINLPENEAKLTLLPQHVFACGYNGCKAFFETTGPTDVVKTSEQYFKHITDHLHAAKREKTDAPFWDYSTQIRNLLRQSSINVHWKSTTQFLQHQFTWQPHNSNVLMKRLQCRLTSNLNDLVDIAITLGSGAFCQPTSPPLHLPTFLLPTKDAATSPASSAQINLGEAFSSFGYPEAPIMPVQGSETLNAPNARQTILPRHQQDTYVGSDVENDFMNSYLDMTNTSNEQFSFVPDHADESFIQPAHIAHQRAGSNRTMGQPEQMFSHLTANLPNDRWPASNEASFDSSGKDSLQQFFDLSQPSTPVQRFAKLARKSKDSLRTRKTSISQADTDMLEAVPPLPLSSYANASRPASSSRHL